MAQTFSQRTGLIESASWLVSKKVDSEEPLRRLVQALVNRDLASQRKDQHLSDAEIGARAEALLRASRYLEDQRYEEFAACLIRDRQWATSNAAGAADFETCIESLPYAESIVSLCDTSGDRAFQRAAITHADRLVRCSKLKREKLKRDMPLSAEAYGRAIHFLVRSSESLERKDYRQEALRIAEEAMQSLYDPRQGMFRSREGSELCRSTDGPGLLILSLLYLDGPDATNASSLHF